MGSVDESGVAILIFDSDKQNLLNGAPSDSTSSHDMKCESPGQDKTARLAYCAAVSMHSCCACHLLSACISSARCCRSMLRLHAASPTATSAAGDRDAPLCSSKPTQPQANG